ncbi:uncharacterized protein L3040_007509 [Drepanopeziza brunnea f. sp. 'multigermtubi']|uniref:uncharacterized protein n=1 Tax=Drepanopeziza brunnea f. sp. 'multigermtubi' TaxID=698441 RepID=UPI00238F97B7|nr:hypothetical protein L3040_007509 [Drepanopeziza brunnea f. sp. 'multigermtubi']
MPTPTVLVSTAGHDPESDVLRNDKLSSGWIQDIYLRAFMLWLVKVEAILAIPRAQHIKELATQTAYLIRHTVEISMNIRYGALAPQNQLTISPTIFSFGASKPVFSTNFPPAAQKYFDLTIMNYSRMENLGNYLFDTGQLFLSFPRPSMAASLAKFLENFQVQR